MLSLYRALIALRRQHEALSVGGIEAVEAHGPVLTYRRSGGGERFAIALNLAHTQAECAPGNGTVLASTHPDRTGAITGPLLLRPDEGVVVKLTG